jgi:type IV secretion system protein VirB10
MALRMLGWVLLTGLPLAAQEAPEAAPAEKTYAVPVGTRVLLSMVNSVSTKNSQPGDRVYLETTFPVVVNSRIVIPAGSYVMGTITTTKRPGKVKGRGEFFLRFDSLMLPNGVTRDFRATLSNLDGRASETLDRDEGVVTGEGNKSGDVRAIGETAAWGASIGGLAGIGRAPGMGVGIGAAAGATAGLLGVLLTRGPEAVLAKGTTVEMVLDRPLVYSETELDFSTAPPVYRSGDGAGPLPSVKSQQGSRRFPQ